LTETCQWTSSGAADEPELAATGIFGAAPHGVSRRFRPAEAAPYRWARPPWPRPTARVDVLRPSWSTALWPGPHLLRPGRRAGPEDTAPGPSSSRAPFAVDLLPCPRCQGRLKLLAMVKEPASIARHLAAEGEPTEVPRRSPGRGSWVGTM